MKCLLFCVICILFTRNECYEKFIKIEVINKTNVLNEYLSGTYELLDDYFLKNENRNSLVIVSLL